MFFPDSAWLDLAARAVVLMALGLGFVIFCVRVVGLRSFSKMTPFDFVATVATGSLLASAVTVSDWQGFAQRLLSIAVLFALQYLLARLRIMADPAEDLLGNEPRLLMRDGVIDEQALKESRVSKGDLIAKLREANALEFDKVRAVVLETTGDVSVLHGTDVDERLLENVRGYR